MENTRNYDECLAKLNALKEEMLNKKKDASAEERKAEEAYSRAFTNMLHTGLPSVALNKGNDSTSDFFVPNTFEKKIVRGLAEKNLLRKLGTVMQTNKRMKIPTVIENGQATWIPEGEPVPVAEANYDEIVLDAYKLAHKIIVSDEMLEDADFDVEDYIQQLFVESISSAEEAAFFTGDGNGKPVGLIRQASVGCISENAGKINYDDILNLIHSVKAPYRKNAVLIMSLDAATKLACIPHYHGDTVWEVPLTKDVHKKLFGYPVYISNHLDDVATGSKPVLFGDFSYFWIGERGKRSVKRLVERYADHGQVAYITSERVDAKLVLPEAVKCLEIKA